MSHKVLVVDDNRLLLERLAAYLQRHGFDVVAEDDALRALEILEERDDIFALVCDLRMPGMNGAELALAAKERKATMLVMIISSMEALMSSLLPGTVGS